MMELNVTPNFDYKKILTFENACEKMNLDPLKLPDVSSLQARYRKSVVACYKLRIIFEAVNNGWIPDWENRNQGKFFPWFVILPSGISFTSVHSGTDFTHTSSGALFCTNTKMKAIYIGIQFKKEYQEYLLS